MIKIDNEFWDGKCVLVTGGSGFVGINILPLINKTLAKVIAPTHSDYDLLDQANIRNMLKKYKPDIVLHLAALSGGIMANKNQPADYCYKNLYMGTSMIHESWSAGVEKYITLIGGCSYPDNANNPIKEDYLWVWFVYLLFIKFIYQNFWSYIYIQILKHISNTFTIK